MRDGACQQDNLIGSAERDGGDRHHDVSILILDGTVEEGALKYYRANMIEKARRRSRVPAFDHGNLRYQRTACAAARQPAGLLHVLDAARTERETLVRLDRVLKGLLVGLDESSPEEFATNVRSILAR